MPNIRRSLGLCVLCCHLAGCAGGYRTVNLTPADPDSAVGADESPALRTGDDLRLLMADGVVIKGTLVRMEERALLLRDARVEGGSGDAFAELPRAEADATPVTYPLADIVRIERLEASAGVGLAIGAVVIGSVACMIYAMDHAMDDFGEP